MSERPTSERNVSERNVSDLKEPEYPKFFWTTIGLSPSVAKQLNPADMEALCNAFQVLTGFDLLEGGSPRVLWEDWKRSRAGRVHGSNNITPQPPKK